MAAAPTTTIPVTPISPTSIVPQGFGTNGAPITTNPASTVPASALTANPSTFSTYFPPQTAATGLAESATASKDAYLSKVASDADTLSSGQTASEQAQAAIYQSLGLIPTEQANDYESSGVNQDQQDVTDITNDMAATGRSFDKQIEAVQANPLGRFGGGVDIVSNALTQQKASTLADQAIVLNARTNNLNTAKSIVDQKVAAETDQLKTQLQGLQYFYSQNASNLSDDQKTLLTDKISDAQNEYDTATANRTAVGLVQLEAARNGAPTSVVTQIGQAQDEQSAIAAAGGYLKTPTKVTGTGTDFTQTQLNKGAQNAGMQISDFKNLSSSDQNYFVNGYAKFQAALKQVNAGNATLADLKSSIDAADLSDQAKQILYTRAGIDPNATDSSGGGFFSSVAGAAGSALNWVSGLFGGGSGS